MISHVIKEKTFCLFKFLLVDNQNQADWPRPECSPLAIDFQDFQDIREALKYSLHRLLSKYRYFKIINQNVFFIY